MWNCRSEGEALANIFMNKWENREFLYSNTNLQVELIKDKAFLTVWKVIFYIERTPE